MFSQLKATIDLIKKFLLKVGSLISKEINRSLLI